MILARTIYRCLAGDYTRFSPGQGIRKQAGAALRRGWLVRLSLDRQHWRRKFGDSGKEKKKKSWAPNEHIAVMAALTFGGHGTILQRGGAGPANAREPADRKGNGAPRREDSRPAAAGRD